MYNRYISASARYDSVYEHSHTTGPFRQRENAQRPPPPPTKEANPLEGIIGGLSGLLKQVHLDRPDSGDILLVLILIFLFLEGEDNTELLIALGLMLVFGLFGLGDRSGDQPSPSPTV